MTFYDDYTSFLYTTGLLALSNSFFTIGFTIGNEANRTIMGRQDENTSVLSADQSLASLAHKPQTRINFFETALHKEYNNSSESPSTGSL